MFRASSNLEEHSMATYGKKAEEKVEKTMHERKYGTLKSGGSGKTVTSRKQAIAIGLSEARAAGGKVPAKKTAAKKATARKTATTGKTTARKTVAKKGR
jgi:topoisomerase IA-like protein